MTNTYNIGASKAPIFLEVQISSLGLAASQANIFQIAGTSPGIPVAHSSSATGGISSQSIGDFTTLLPNQALQVFTRINLLGTTAVDRAANEALVAATYILSGGDDGVKIYSNPDVDYIDPSVNLDFVIELT